MDKIHEPAMAPQKVSIYIQGSCLDYRILSIPLYKNHSINTFKGATRDTIKFPSATDA